MQANGNRTGAVLYANYAAATLACLDLLAVANMANWQPLRTSCMMGADLWAGVDILVRQGVAVPRFLAQPRAAVRLCRMFSKMHCVLRRCPYRAL